MASEHPATPTGTGGTMVEELIGVSKRQGEIAMAQFITTRLTEFVKANPLTLEATPAVMRTFLADLCTAMQQRCEHGT